MPEIIITLLTEAIKSAVQAAIPFKFLITDMPEIIIMLITEEIRSAVQAAILLKILITDMLRTITVLIIKVKKSITDILSKKQSEPVIMQW